MLISRRPASLGPHRQTSVGNVANCRATLTVTARGDGVGVISNQILMEAPHPGDGSRSNPPRKTRAGGGEGGTTFTRIAGREIIAGVRKSLVGETSQIISDGFYV